MDNYLEHYGVARRSGRYPWGSGDDPEQHNKSFLGYVEDLRKKGVSEVDIAKGLGMTTSELRAKKTIAKAEQRASDASMALKLKDKGYSNVAIGKRMGINESSVRALLDPALKERSSILKVTADTLRNAVDTKDYIDIGVGVERHMNISRTKLKAAVSLLEEEGYKVYYVQVEQAGTGKKTNIMTLAKPDSTYSEVARNKDKIRMITDYSVDGGRSFLGLEPIRNIDSKRVLIRYDEDGGSKKDGVIELRRGVEDLSLGSAKYAQVRIGVDGTHYLKGMAMYNDDFPPGIDIIYNTNKSKNTPKEKVFKEMKDDVDNPFGAMVRQKKYIDKNGKEQLSALNIVGYKDTSGEEGSWGEWSKTLSSQMLSKQSPALAKKQLALAYDVKQEEFNDIMKLTNPVVKKSLLKPFADGCDSSAEHLKAAALPRQKAHVILPLNNIKDTEIYAPNYRNGESVILIRYPHGGIFEIPELTVNNKNAEGKRLLGQAKDAVGIHPNVAEQLSGADFDGDTVLVIPKPAGSTLKTSAPLEGLKNFDPKTAYPGYEGMPKMSKTAKGMEMGNVSNLITDMTIKGAQWHEITRAVKHSMVVIDAEKHGLNYKQSYIDNGIGELKAKYQGGKNRGASTLISRASSTKLVGVRKEKIDPLTGEKTYEYTGETYTRKDGKVVLRTISSTRMAETSDAYTLSSGTAMENVYAAHANRMKALANEARREYLKVNDSTYSPSANRAYAVEVATLKAKLNIALKNAPLERQAQLLQDSVVKAKRQANPDMDGSELKKIKGQALTEARARVGAKKVAVDITDREWEAIQAGAVSKTTLTKILENTDLDRVKQLSTPRTALSLSPAKTAKAKQYLNNGYTQAEVAEMLGVSTGTIAKLL